MTGRWSLCNSVRRNGGCRQGPKHYEGVGEAPRSMRIPNVWQVRGPFPPRKDGTIASHQDPGQASSVRAQEGILGIGGSVHFGRV